MKSLAVLKVFTEYEWGISHCLWNSRQIFCWCGL